MTTQLRLVDTPETTPAPRRARASARVNPGSGRTDTSGRAGRTRSARSTGTARRAARWAGELHLDARTRTVGRAGVAAAREALERVAAEQARARAERDGRSQRAS